MLTLLWMQGVAHGFCGTFVGAPGTELTNHTSQVVIARQGERTVLTLVADYEGEVSDFALLIPVPPGLTGRDVRTVDAEVVDRLDRYSTPRLVQYTCRTAIGVEHVNALSGGCMLGGCGADQAYDTSPTPVDLEFTDGGVTVEAAFREAEYDVVILSATGAGGLYDWLDDNGFAVPPGGEDVLQTYIDGGAQFLAAKVHLEPGDDSGPVRLSPLQLRYESPVWSLPIRIGTISAAGEQEVVIYTLTHDGLGDVVITNYPQLEVEDECMLPASTELQDHYVGALEGARGPEGPGWVTEYSWLLYSRTQDSGYHCDPCTVEEEELYDAGELQALGYLDGLGLEQVDTGLDAGGPLLTRIRMVYRPDEVPEDLVLDQTGWHDENQQIRFIRHDRRLEFLFPICGEGWVEEPGMCGDEQDSSARGVGAAAAGGLVGALALLAGRRRR